jgi:hypothetical protein
MRQPDRAEVSEENGKSQSCLLDVDTRENHWNDGKLPLHRVRQEGAQFSVLPGRAGFRSYEDDNRIHLIEDVSDGAL